MNCSCEIVREWLLHEAFVVFACMQNTGKREEKSFKGAGRKNYVKELENWPKNVQMSEK